MQTVKNKVIIFLLAVIVIAGQLWYNQQRLSRIFYIISLVVVIAGILMFYLSFEGRKPKDREIVLVAVLSGITVASRIIFFLTPQIKPMAAIVILCAVIFGKETGFLVGSTSMLISNFFFSQGPFTPFSMVAMGLVGYFAGMLFCGKKPQKRLLCLYGFMSVYFIYGVIMNWSTILLYTDKISVGYVVAVFGAAFYFDLIHAISTVLFIAVMYYGFSTRLERVKKRYGML